MMVHYRGKEANKELSEIIKKFENLIKEFDNEIVTEDFDYYNVMEIIGKITDLG